MAVTTNLQTQSGNRIIVTLNNIPVGLLQSVRMNDDYSPEMASGIGDIHAVEYVPTAARHTLSVTNMVLRVKRLVDQGIVPDNGDAVLLGIVFNIEALSKDDGSLVRKYLNCSYASGDLEINKHAIIMQSGVFNCLDTTSVGSP